MDHYESLLNPQLFDQAVVQCRSSDDRHDSLSKYDFNLLTFPEPEKEPVVSLEPKKRRRPAKIGMPFTLAKSFRPKLSKTMRKNRRRYLRGWKSKKRGIPTETDEQISSVAEIDDVEVGKEDKATIYGIQILENVLCKEEDPDDDKGIRAQTKTKHPPDTQQKPQKQVVPSSRSVLADLLDTPCPSPIPKIDTSCPFFFGFKNAVARRLADEKQGERSLLQQPQKSQTFPLCDVEFALSNFVKAPPQSYASSSSSSMTDLSSPGQAASSSHSRFAPFVPMESSPSSSSSQNLKQPSQGYGDLVDHLAQFEFRLDSNKFPDLGPDCLSGKPLPRLRRGLNRKNRTSRWRKRAFEAAVDEELERYRIQDREQQKQEELEQQMQQQNRMDLEAQQWEMSFQYQFQPTTYPEYSGQNSQQCLTNMNKYNCAISTQDYQLPQQRYQSQGLTHWPSQPQF